jgi:tetratricopeptide (TPR) repeat protein
MDRKPSTRLQINPTLPSYARLARCGNLLVTDARSIALPEPSPVSPTPARSMWPSGRARCTGAIAIRLLCAQLGLGVAACGRGDAAESTASGSMTPAPAPAPAEPAVDDDALATRYLELKAGYDAAPESFGGKAGSPELIAITHELRAMSNAAKDAHLRANAAVLLGALHQERGGWEEAAGAYRRAALLVPDDAGPHMALARALLETGEFKAAAESQLRAVELDPDNLEQYLALGELRIKAGDADGGARAYADYEVRRRAIIDGLTLKHDGAYQVSIEDRIGCAESLGVARDVGTAFALLYALDTEPEASVRVAIVWAMATHRFVGYQPRLVKHLARERDDSVRRAITAAILEIDRDPVDTRLDGPPPAETPAGQAPPAQPDAPATGTAAAPSPAPTGAGAAKPDAVLDRPGSPGSQPRQGSARGSASAGSGTPAAAH